MRKRSVGGIFILMIFFLLVSGRLLLHAQQLATSALTGVVSDGSGASVPKAKVMLTSEATHFMRTTTTNNDGVYAFSELTPGLYSLSVQSAGFQSVTLQGLQFYVGQSVVQNVRMQVGRVNESVTVSASAIPLLQQSNAEIGTVIEQKTITEMPLNGRSFLQLNLLAPGATRSKNSNTFDAVQINPNIQSFNINGQHGDYNRFLLDGTSIKEFNTDSISFAPSVDAIQEFQVATSNYSADLGTEAGGQINVATRSGTNQFHGDLFEFFRNDKMNATNFLDTNVVPFHHNQFGATLGGPVFIPKIYSGKNKSFFFFSYQGTRFNELDNLKGHFPTPAQLAGDLSTLVPAGGSPVVDPTTGQPFPGNVIPQNRMPANLLTFLQNGIGKGPWIPAPNYSNPAQPQFNYSRTGSNKFIDDQYIVRFDQQLGASTFLYVRYAQDDASINPPNLNPNWSVSTTQPVKSIAGNVTHSFTPSLLWNATIGYSKFAQKLLYSTNFHNDIMGGILHINGFPTDPATWGVVSWFTPNYDNMGELYAAPNEPHSDVLEMRTDFTKIAGKHSIKFGGEFDRFYDTVMQFTEGNYTFSGIMTNYDLGDFLLGLPSNTFNTTAGINFLSRSNIYAGFVQDDWRVTPNLTVNVGLRYDHSGIPESSNHSFATWFTGPGSLHSSLWNNNYNANYVPQLVVSTSSPQGITFLGQQHPLYTGIPFVPAKSVGLPEALGFPINKDIGPRLGFAYSFPHSQNTVVRGGIGVFYQRDEQNKYGDLSLNPPFDYNLTASFNRSNFQTWDWFNPFNSGSSGGASTVGAFQVSPNSRDGMITAWNFGVEHSVRDVLLSAAYVGNQGHYLPNLEFPNQAKPGPGSLASRQLWPSFGALWAQNSVSNANYNSMQLKAQKTFSRGLSFMLSYTWSHSIDDGGGTFVGEGGRGFSAQDEFNRAADRSNSFQDIRHRFVASYVYQLPFGIGRTYMNKSHLANALLGQWQVQGITTVQTGSPVNITQACNRANTNFGAQHPDLVGDPTAVPGGRSTLQKTQEWFNTAAFKNVCPDASGPGPFTWGPAIRNDVFGPGTSVTDFGVAKEVPFSERARLQFRAEAFNVFNHAILGQPGTVAGANGFGQIGGVAIPARQLQLALKLMF